ncbi:MAG TPA: 1-acyl-sn-glycerol-3-phosphate acyltransferase [Burkholderiales bacterium]
MRQTSGGSAGFAAVRALARLLLAVFYRRIDVVGAARVPAQGGLIVAANHHNSIVDAMLLLVSVPRPLRPLAKAQLFEHFLIGPFLRMVGALPVHRRQEAGDDPHKNDALFEATTRTLRAGGGIFIFPEGRTQPEPVLLELRTGAARMLLAARPAEATLLPAGLVFRRPGIFREGEALVLFGEPVATQGKDAREITESLAAALRALIVEAEDLETLGLLEAAESVWSAAGGTSHAPEARVRWLQLAAERYRGLAREQPERLADFVRRLQALVREVEESGFSLHSLAVPRVKPVMRFALRQAFALFVAAPLALCGFLLHGVPYALVALVLRVPHSGEEDATIKMAAGLVLYPLCWALEGWLAWRYGGAPALAALLVLLVPSGFVALSWRERLARLEKGIRGLARLLRDPRLAERLRAQRDALALELRQLAAQGVGGQGR